jgi:hypothetical protein
MRNPLPLSGRINWIINTMQDEIARVNAAVLRAFNTTLAAALPQNKGRIRAAFMYRANFAEKWLRYKLEGRSNKEICVLEGASRSS